MKINSKEFDNQLKIPVSPNNELLGTLSNNMVKFSMLFSKKNSNPILKTYLDLNLTGNDNLQKPTVNPNLIYRPTKIKQNSIAPLAALKDKQEIFPILSKQSVQNYTDESAYGEYGRDYSAPEEQIVDQESVAPVYGFDNNFFANENNYEPMNKYNQSFNIGDLGSQLNDFLTNN